MTGGYIYLVSLCHSHSLSLFRGQSFRNEFFPPRGNEEHYSFKCPCNGINCYSNTFYTTHIIMDNLSMKKGNTHIVDVLPVKDNIAYYVAQEVYQKYLAL